MLGNWGTVLCLLRLHREREEERKIQRKVALSHLSKGEIGKAVSLLTSLGVASTKDPNVMAALRPKYVEQGKKLPPNVSVTEGGVRLYP